ncbi:uncharacterized protein LOC141909176 [Tubulanus polymorphus]|uniref:uncharacterized protein LOC141909176 n=1 Tax=Tubulanus polymorphus TaxID=672921 RepID=UPI003DA66815
MIQFNKTFIQPTFRDFSSLLFTLAHEHDHRGSSYQSCSTEKQNFWRKGQQQHQQKKWISPEVTLTTDASMSGWGAILGDLRTGGHWTEQEQLLHINVLELRAVLYGLKSFSKFLGNKHILIQTDNSVSVSYINNQGGPKSPV